MANEQNEGVSRVQRLGFTILLLCLLVGVFDVLAIETSSEKAKLISWFQKSTGITNGMYKIKRKNSSKSCLSEGYVVIGLGDQGFVEVTFGGNLMVAGVGQKLSVDKVTNPGCVSKTETNKTKSGLNLSITRSCGKGAEEKSQKTIERIEGGFVVENAKKGKGDELVERIRCFYTKASN